MFYPNADDPYGQPTLPYQPYKTHPDPLLSQQRAVVSATTTRSASPSRTMPARPSNAAPASPRLSKAQALEFARTCKKCLVAGSIVVFGILTGLVAGHVTGTTSNQATPASNTPSTTSPSTGGGFFQQQQGGGNGFGNNNSSQPPVSGSNVS
jgi:hypothetical protein